MGSDYVTSLQGPACSSSHISFCQYFKAKYLKVSRTEPFYLSSSHDGRQDLTFGPVGAKSLNRFLPFFSPHFWKMSILGSLTSNSCIFNHVVSLLSILEDFLNIIVQSIKFESDHLILSSQKLTSGFLTLPV